MPRRRVESKKKQYKISQIKKRRRRLKVVCDCPDCNGNLVDKRTKKRHDYLNLALPVQESDDSSDDDGQDNLQHDSSDDDDQDNLQQQTPPPNIEQIPLDIEQETNEGPQEENRQISDEPILPRKRVRNINRPVPITEGYSDSNFEEDESETSSDDINMLNETINEIFESYSSPSFTPFQDSNDTRSTNNQSTSNNNSSLWILLWIMKFRTRFNLPETATESLIKFMKLVLKEIGGSKFDSFPDTLYLARKDLRLQDKFHSFAVCPNCHKLYNKQEVVEFRENNNLEVMKCRHIKFPNSTARRSKLCQTPLSQKVMLLNNRISIKPELIYPFAGIRQQLATMYRRPNFEKSLRHWAERTSFSNILTDIYDGQVWRNLKENGENSPNFFRPEVADSHLGLMLNLDWFQPYEGVPHSTGVIYAAICNLPREVRFKRENMLILGILPGPKK